MQTETTQSSTREWLDAIKARKVPDVIEVEIEKQETNPELSQYLRAMREAGQKIDPRISHDEEDNEKWSDEKKIQFCTRNTNANFGVSKMPDGSINRTPTNCNKCQACYTANALRLKERTQGIIAMAESSEVNGQWRKKVVDEGTEAQSLKRHIKRNQNDMRFEVQSIEQGKSEVWSYVEDEPGKDMGKIYGEKDNPEDINIDNLYRRIRESGKKFSTGSAFKKKAVVAKKEDTERIPIPRIMIKDAAKQQEAEKIIEETNYIEKAKDAAHAKRLFIYQFKFILQELEKANIEIRAIHVNYFNIAKSELLDGWNNNIKFWMSMNASSLDLENDAYMDNVDESKIRPEIKAMLIGTDHLIFPKSYTKPVVN